MDNAVRKLICDELQKNIVIDGDMTINRKSGEVLGHEVDYTHKF